MLNSLFELGLKRGGPMEWGVNFDLKIALLVIIF